LRKKESNRKEKKGKFTREIIIVMGKKKKKSRGKKIRENERGETGEREKVPFIRLFEKKKNRA